MNTKAFFPCAGGSNLILGIGRENQIFLLRKKLNITWKMIKYWSFWKKFNKGGVPLNFHEGGGGLKYFFRPPPLHLNFLVKGVGSKNIFRPHPQHKCFVISF